MAIQHQLSDEEDKSQTDSSDSSYKRNIKHYFMVQNRAIYYEDLEEFENKVMLSIDIPRYFYLDKATIKTPAEIDYERRMKESVIYVTFSKDIDAKKIAELFNIYGDINVTFLSNSNSLFRS